MTIADILKYIFPAVTGLIAFGILVSLTVGNKKNILDQMKNGMGRLRKRAGLVALFTVIYFASFVGWKQLQGHTEASVVLGFHYPEASRGLSPNKTRFNASEVLADDVLETAILKGGMDVDARDLRGSLKVEPLKAGDYISVDQYYISTEYLLKYKASPKTMHLNPELVVDMVSHAYYAKFVRAYSRKTNLLDLDLSLLDGREYQEIARIFDVQAINIQTYAAMCANESDIFRSEKNGETFPSIEKRVKNFREVQLERYQAFVLKHGLAKIPDGYIAKINYQNKIYNKDYMKNLAHYQIRLDAINMYERDMATIVEVPTYNNDGEFYMSRTKIGVDVFASEAEVTSQKASDLQLKIEKNQEAVAGIQKAGGGDGAVKAQADSMIDDMKEELKRLSDIMKETLEEYNKKMTNDYISISSTEQSFQRRYGLKKAAVLSVFSAVLLCTWIVVLPERKK